MISCKRCFSYAINIHSHGRDGTEKELCDVCYWRNLAEIRLAYIRQLETDVDVLKPRVKRLEESLSEIESAMKQPASNRRLMQIAGPARQVINIIKQAKGSTL